MTAGSAERQALVEAGIALTSELSHDGVLERLLEIAAELTGARYAALGVIDRDGLGLERFLTRGLDEDAIRAIGDLPRGRGVLGALIADARTLRLGELADDPRSVGFPPHHPPMHTFLGVPIRVRGIAYGNLYLTEKAGGAEFTDEDEDFVELLAAQAGIAIDNARLFEAANRWSRQLESVNEVSAALVSEQQLPRLLELVGARLQELLSARIVLVALPHGSVLRVDAATDPSLVGLELGPDSKTSRVIERGRPERIDDVALDPEIDRRVAEQVGARSLLVVPLVVGARPVGAILAVDRLPGDPRFRDEDIRLAETFARGAAVAVDRSQRVARDVLRRTMEAQELERRRLARELHDETGQALTSILLGLRAIETARTPEATAAAAAELRDLAVATLQGVRQLAVDLRPKALDDFGLVPALQRLAHSMRERFGLDVQVEARLGAGRLDTQLETTVYRLVQEALTNVVKHAGARHVSVLLARKDGRVTVMIEDDGSGFDPEAARPDGLGLLGMRERVDLFDGVLRVDAEPGAGTTIVAELPVP